MLVCSRGIGRPRRDGDRRCRSEGSSAARNGRHLGHDAVVGDRPAAVRQVGLVTATSSSSWITTSGSSTTWKVRESRRRARRRRRSCRPFLSVAFEHRLAHRGKGQAPLEADDRRQVHRRPRVPGAAPTRSPVASPPPGPPPRPLRRARRRPMAGGEDGSEVCGHDWASPAPVDHTPSLRGQPRPRSEGPKSGGKGLG